MKPHISSIKIASFIFLFFFIVTAYSQEEQSDNKAIDYSSKNITKKDDSLKLDVKSNNKKTPVLSKVIKELDKKIETVIIENKMLTMRSSALISAIDQD